MSTPCCSKCGGEIPSSRRTDAKYCTQRCRAAAEKLRQRRRREGERYCPVCGTVVFRKTYCTQACYRSVLRVSRRVAYQVSVYGHAVEPLAMHKDRYSAARAQGYRSGLEVSVARELESQGIPFKYEELTIPYQQPQKPRRYTPDILLENGIIVELKGAFVTADRQKHLLIKQQHPQLDIRFVFSNPQTRISKQSATTYAAWCEHKGFRYAKGSIPQAWLKEPMNMNSLAAIDRLLED